MNIQVEKGKLEEKPSDLLVVTAFETQKKYTGALAEVDAVLHGLVKEVLEIERFEGKKAQTMMVHTHGKIAAARVLVVGLGAKKQFGHEQVRRLGAIAVKQARASKARSITISLDGLTNKTVTPEMAGQALAEGALLANYSFLKYKGEDAKKAEENKITSVTVLEQNSITAKQMLRGTERGNVYAQATMVVRDMVNEPAVHMRPLTLALAAKELQRIPGVKVTVYNKTEIKKMNMGSFLSVAAGSDEDPYFIHLKYTPKKKKAKKLVLCGKGITFDSGGLSLKPSNYMDTMKQDMAGGATVLGVFSALATLKPNVELHGVIPATENMPSGKATRPGDVVHAYNGTTIEVTNTDAEGRLVLADALAWAEKTIEPDYMVDLATLTGAAIVALGQEVAAMLGTKKELIAQLKTASEQAGEPLWEMPLVEEYNTLLDSEIADIQNAPKTSWAGTILGGLFLQRFVKKTPWVHIDIAGPAWVEHQINPYAPKGASGFGVRTLLNFIQALR